MHTENLHEILAGVIRDAFFAARDKGETMYQASDVAAAHVLSILEPSMLRLQVEVDKLLEQWEQERRTLPSGDWQTGVADSLLKRCIQELSLATRTAQPVELTLEVG
jgi:hypothetical protein